MNHPPKHRVEPGPGQESVWDYPRPPRLEATTRRIRVVLGGVTIVDTTEACRVLETSHPPVYYVPPAAVRDAELVQSPRVSFCEWKGEARYWSVTAGGKTVRGAAWSYPEPTSAFAAIRDYLAFYPAMMDACYVDDKKVEPQAGGFYGGWRTRDIVGPFKGEPGTEFW